MLLQYQKGEGDERADYTNGRESDRNHVRAAGRLQQTPDGGERRKASADELRRLLDVLCASPERPQARNVTRPKSSAQ